MAWCFEYLIQCFLLHSIFWLKFWRVYRHQNPISQLSNLNRSLKLVLMRVGNHRELVDQWFYRISFFESISSNTKGGWSHLDHTIIFKDFKPCLIYDILEISWVIIKYDHLSAWCLWCLKSKDHIHNCDMNQLDWNFGIIPSKDSFRLKWTLSSKSTHYLSLVSLHW